MTGGRVDHPDRTYADWMHRLERQRRRDRRRRRILAIATYGLAAVGAIAILVGAYFASVWFLVTFR